MGIRRRAIARALPLLVVAVSCSSAAEPAPDPVAPAPSTEPGEPAAPTESPDPEVAPLDEPSTEPSPGEMPPAVAGPSAEMKQLVEAHNRYRAEHCAPPLTWSADIARVAQGWADELNRRNCAFEHSRSKYGENLAGGSAGHLDADQIAAMWYQEIAQYDWNQPGFSMQTGHFTQVVWAGSKRLGCGVTTCGGMSIWVCNYDPPGNMQGAYRANVKPASCK
jgi:uncharacterized protein YkwD